MLANQILDFYKNLKLKARLPKGVSFMNPFQDEQAFQITKAFYEKFYKDDLPRKIILGINPGRFGGGITGIPFTDPINLEIHCGISNNLIRKPELSSTFIYSMISLYGGAEKFYRNFFITALSPLGFTKDGKNLNYYDVKDLQDAVEPFIIDCIQKQLQFNIDTKVGFCLGEGANFRYLNKLNERYNFFGKIEPLPHPRFIMQYKRKQLQAYLERYVEVLG